MIETLLVALGLVAALSLLGRRTIDKQIDTAIEADSAVLHGCWVGVAGIFTLAVIISVLVIWVKMAYVLGAN